MKKVKEFIKNPEKSLVKLAIPILISMSAHSLYNIIDTAFVGRLGNDAIAALSFSFPLFFILIAVNIGISVGMGSRISRFLGDKKKKAAENTALHGIFMSIIASVILLIMGLIFQRRYFAFSGAEGAVLELAVDYFSIILFGIFFMFISSVIGRVFISQGDTKTSTQIHVSAIILNIILDPILIYGLNLGVKGAALATVIAYIFAIGLSLYFLKTKSELKLNFREFKFRKYITKEITKVGIPASFTMLFIAVYIMFINKLSAGFGIEYVAAFGIASKLHNVALMPMIAMASALITIVGMFYGAKRYDLLQKIINYAIKKTLIWATVVGLIFFIFAEVFLRIFTTDQNLIDIAAAYMRIDVFTFPLVAITLLIGRAMQGMGTGTPALVFNFMRTILIAIPLAYTLIFIFGFGFLSIPISTIVGAFIVDFIAFA